MNQPSAEAFPDETVITRLADEGLPICAIARSLRVPSDFVRVILQGAVDNGIIVEYPREDWPPDSNRNDRGFITGNLLDDDYKLQLACSRHFRTTRQQSTVLGMLLKRTEVTKEQLHQTIERSRTGAGNPDREMTDIKLVDVLICILRRKLKPFGLEIKTIWGTGYLMEAKHRAKAIHDLQQFMREANDPGVLVAELEGAAA